MTEEAKSELYHKYCLSYCKALEAVLMGKAISEATQEERHAIISMVCDDIENDTEFFGDEAREFILDKFIEDSKGEVE